MHALFLYILAFANAVSMVHLGMYIIGANAHDALTYRKERLAKKRVGPVGPQPLVSVVIPAHNEAVVIRRTIDFVRASTYKNIEIIVVDDGSTDQTDAVVRDYIRGITTPTTIARYFARTGRDGHLARRFLRVSAPAIRTVRVTQTNAGKAAAMNNAIANFVRGDITMCLDADSVLHPLAIEKAVKHFQSDKRIIGVAANVRVMESRHWLGVLQRFEHMIGYRSKKFYSLTNSEFIIGGVGSSYRTEVLKSVGLYDTDTLTEDIGLSMKLISAVGNKDARIIYAPDVVAMTEGVETFGQLLRQRYRWKLGNLQNLFKYRHLIGNLNGKKFSKTLTLYRLPMAVLSEILLMLQPILFGYIIYVSIAHQTPDILLGAYITVTGYALWNIWPDEHLSNKQKMQMSLIAPVLYVLFYAMDVVQINAILKVLREPAKVFRLNSGHTTWVSPTRSGNLITSVS